MLVPTWLPSAAPIVMPGKRDTAEVSDVEPCDCISDLVITVTDWGVSRRSPTRSSEEFGFTKSSLGRLPVTVTVCMVAGAPLGVAGLFSVVGGVFGSGGG